MQNDLRDVFFDFLIKEAEINEKLILLSVDVGAFKLKEFKNRFPKRYINTGVSEQNTVLVAAGLALSEKIPVVFSLASFVTTRCYEQLKLYPSAMNLPMIIIGLGPGISFSFDGPTHHSTNDIIILRSLPNIQIYNPNDSFTLSEALCEGMHRNKPTYIRLDKGSFIEKQETGTNFRILKPLNKVNIIATGKIIDSLLDLPDMGLIDVFRLDNIDVELKYILNKSDKLIVVEENMTDGGLSTIISDNVTKEIHRITLPKQHIIKYGSREWMLKHYKLDKESIRRRINDYVNL